MTYRSRQNKPPYERLSDNTIIMRGVRAVLFATLIYLVIPAVLLTAAVVLTVKVLT